MSQVTVAATQMACGWNRDENIRNGEWLVREAKGKGAQIVLLQELFETPYFCQDQHQEHFALAAPVTQNPAVLHFQKLAAELELVLPISFFERANNAHYNAIAIIDADGRNLGVYRKSHIPDGPGYREKFYFNPGDTGFKVWSTRHGRIGVAVCWDQWFPEAARAMALKGAEILFYPTAIGSEPQDASVDSKEHWQTVMRGHAGANLTPLVASNRIGLEVMTDSQITFYGSSFIAGPQGEVLAEASRDKEAVITATLDLERIRAQRANWGLFRDRRPDLYDPLLTLDGETRR
ncbi:MAG TPA: N-carbamoylputrescine amidase [Alphaproteobacteria bacterium]|nr:N-carbamoylputrescine amidase [Alphaproteobacteria bacterium]